MTATPPIVDQAAYWNGAAGRKWTDFQDSLDVTFVPVLDELLHRADIRPGERVIDIGCGCGASAIALAERVGSNGHVTALDISAEMLARARQRTPAALEIDYLQADAASHPFAKEAADALVSRFGVMFFDDPVQAFTNLAAALRRGGRLAFVCWRAPRENPYFIAAVQEAYKHVPRLPEMKPEDPGPFAFASEERVRAILTEAGFGALALAPFDAELDMAAGRGLDQALTVATSIGPASRALEGQPQDKVEAARADIRTMLARHQQGARVLLKAAMWMVTAVKP
ncbi:class I SAM-dependent methyltransferase [Bradyrhizobium sp. WD16]|uniref:class I SAM-dependent methyltransferase n=1 Tax=Bradyrhizobium sp. WD16 TaxID=1521768 RepID=UPI0020A37DD4|nr:methyltransferase domain-containing protein [Bradyrhizobium sp. WD16]UTD28155.1 SAM-dependent methyltransferase [Bradyrhizobium sp. WD16]